MSKCILVTGGAGFVGHHVVSFLLEKNFYVIVIDNLSSGNIKNLDLSNPNLEFHQNDVCNEEILQNLIIKSDLVIHLAAVVGLKNVIANPLLTLEVNIQSTKLIASECAKLKVPLVFFSSSAVYSCNKDKNHYSETAITHNFGLNNFSLYAETKIICETICEVFRRSQGLKYLILRPFNLIGTGQSSNYGMVVPNFIKRVLAAKPIKIYGDGTQSRTFSDIDEAIELMWQLVENTGCYNKIFNLATNTENISILELADTICRISNINVKYEFISYEKIYGENFIDSNDRKPSLIKLQQYIQLKNATPLESTIRKIYEYEKQRCLTKTKANVAS